MKVARRPKREKTPEQIAREQEKFDAAQKKRDEALTFTKKSLEKDK